MREELCRPRSLRRFFTSAAPRGRRRGATALKLSIGLSIALPLSLSPAEAPAQIVNVQPLISADEEKQGFSFVLEGSADIRRGNTNLVALSGNAIAQYRARGHLAFVLARGDFGARDGAPFMNKDLEHARYRVRLAGPLAGEVFVQHDRDAFRRLSLRALAGLGLRLHMIQWDVLDASLGAAYLLEYERLAGGEEPDAGATTLAHRLSTYVVLSTHVTDVLDLGVTMYVQPRLTRASDIRLLSETSLLAKAAKHFSLKLTLTSAFDSEPPASVVPLDTTLKGALQVSF
jgi:hypothetical protein